jgi:hypothetical protein
MNPLHPEPRRFLLDLVLEAVEKYDLDGVQLDDRIVWPYVTMGYDDYTVAMYRNEHGGEAPPADHKDPAWMRWRADKVNEYAKQFVEEVRRAKPGAAREPEPGAVPVVLRELPAGMADLGGVGARQRRDAVVGRVYPAVLSVRLPRVQGDLGPAGRQPARGRCERAGAAHARGYADDGQPARPGAVGPI